MTTSSAVSHRSSTTRRTPPEHHWAATEVLRNSGHPLFGCKPVPSLKLATNTVLFRRVGDDMDLDCGTVADGEVSLEEMGKRVFEALVAAASGARTKSELLGAGDEEFAPWQLGAVM